MGKLNRRVVAFVSFTIVLVILASLVLMKGYSMYRNVHDKLDKLSIEKTQTNTIVMNVMGQDILLNPGDNTVSISPDQLTTEFPIEITFTNSNNFDIIVDGEPIEDGKAQVHFTSLSVTARPVIVEMHNRENGVVGNAHIVPYPKDLPVMSIFGRSPNKGMYYFIAENYLIKMNQDGDLIYYKRETKTSVDISNFHRIDSANGSTRYAYAKTSDHQMTMNYFYIIMDENYNVIDKAQYLQKTSLVEKDYLLDSHDFVYFEDGHYLLITYYPRHVTNIPKEVPHPALGARVLTTYFQEVQNGRVIWEWDSSEHPELYAYNTNPDTSYFNTTQNETDYMHFNSIKVDPADGNYVCSFRHLDAILKIDSKTGDIIWILGGPGDQFGLTEEQYFSHQHDARLTEDGFLTLFDNANGTDHPSRALEFRLDEENKRVLSFHSYEPEQQKRLWMGSAERLSDGIYLIGWGGRGGDSASDLLFSEIDFNQNRVLMEVVCPTNNYRVYKFDR